MRRFPPSLLATLILIGTPAVALAGMPMITLSDVARLRIQSISFFLAGLLLAAWMVQLLWNQLGRDFTWLPALTYGKAVGVVVLWGLLFVLVLTMISGARELMTPGAWEKHGLTYRLAEEPAATNASDPLDELRRKKLEVLRTALWTYAQSHDGQFPPDRSTGYFLPETWEVPGHSGMRYLYVDGKKAGQDALALAYEPDLFGSQRLVLLSNGDIRPMASEEIVRGPVAERQP